jgi:hypothetical protein
MNNDRGRLFEMANVVPLVHSPATLQFPAKLLVSKCDLFGDDPELAAFPFHMTSRVSESDFPESVSVLEGMTVKVTTNNFKGLPQLSEEFRFRDLCGHFSQFRYRMI